jgi:hypothetical protein
MKHFILKAIYVPIIMAVAQPPIALGQSQLPESPIKTTNDIITFITNAARFAFGLLMALAVVFILYASFIYLTAAGDDTKVEKAKNIIVYAVIAIIVALLAGGFASLIGSFFGVNLPSIR